MAIRENANLLNSSDVRVFPCAYRDPTIDAKARLNLEENFKALGANGLGKRTDGSYVISKDSSTLKVVLGGYYFELPANIADNYVFIITAVTTDDYRILSSLDTSVVSLGDTLDNNGTFYGLGTTNTDPETFSDIDHATAKEIVHYVRIDNCEDYLPEIQHDTTPNSLILGSTTFTGSLYGSSPIDLSFPTINTSNISVGSTITAPSIYCQNLATCSSSYIHLNDSFIPQTCGPANLLVNLGGYDIDQSYIAHFGTTYTSNVCLQHTLDENGSYSIGLKYDSAIPSGFGCNLYYSDSLSQRNGVLNINGFNRLSILGNTSFYTDGEVHLYSSLFAENIYTYNIYPRANESYNIGTDSSKIQSIYTSKIYADTIKGYSQTALTLSNTSGISLTADGGNASISMSASSIYLSGKSITLNAAASNIKLANESVGTASKPIYLDSGKPTECEIGSGAGRAKTTGGGYGTGEIAYKSSSDS